MGNTAWVPKGHEGPVKVPGDKIKSLNFLVLTVYRPIRPKSAVPQPHYYPQYEMWTIEKNWWTIPLREFRSMETGYLPTVSEVCQQWGLAAMWRLHIVEAIWLNWWPPWLLCWRNIYHIQLRCWTPVGIILNFECFRKIERKKSASGRTSMKVSTATQGLRVRWHWRARGSTGGGRTVATPLFSPWRWPSPFAGPAASAMPSKSHQ